MSQVCTRCSRTLDLPVPVAFCPYCGNSLGATLAFDPGQTTAPTAAAPAREMPQQLGEYRLLGRLGEGGMGVVYEGEHLPTGRRVAVKLIDVEASGDALERFRQEGKLASAVSHPRCVFVYAADQDAGRPFIVLELMPGQTLDDLVRERGPLPLGVAIRHALDLVEGLEQVHALGVIHRDVKPSNSFLDRDGRVKVGDFGLARSLQPDAKLTRTGTFVGTPLFASPEQIKAQPLDARADVYSVCATLYFLLTGRAPHDRGDGDSMAVMARVVSEEPPPVRSLRPDLPVGLERILARGLARDRERRQPDLAALRGELSAFRLAPPGGRLVGARLAAYVVDFGLLTPVASLVALLLGEAPFVEPPGLAARLTASLAVVAYFSVLEGAFGCGVGKWLFGLRVWGKGDVGPPGLRRGLLRTLSWYGLVSFPSILVLFVLPPRQENLPLIGVFQSTLFLCGVGALCCRMQKANGYSLLHDLLSGTRVVPRPRPEQLARFPSKSAPSVVRKAKEGETLGPFRVLGEVWRGADERVLLALDPALDRSVWLWLRPLDRPAIPSSRRDDPSATRPRWLAHGEHDGRRWDAFLLPTGCPLADAVAAAGRRPWEQVRTVLLELSGELGREDDLSGGYCLSQVWLSPEGRVLLMDVPLSGEMPDHANVLAEAALVLLEGRPPKGRHKRPPRAVMPTHARQLLGKLPYFGGSLDVAAFHEQLASMKDRPTQVSRQARLLHLGMLLMLQLVCCGGVAFFGVAFFGVVMTAKLENNLDRTRRTTLAGHDQGGAALAAVVAAPTANPLGRLLPAWHLHEYQRPRERLVAAMERLEPVIEKRAARISAKAREGMQKQGKAEVAPPRLPRLDPYGGEAQWMAQEANRLDQAPRSGLAALPVVFGLMFVPAGFCVLSALLSRRGWRSMVVGLDVVRGDGAPAGRLRCAWRALVAWVPVLGMLMLARWLEETYWDGWTPERSPWLLTLADACWLGVPGVVLALAALILWAPARSLHDRLSGTWLVPR